MDAAGRATRALSHHARYERGRVVREAESAAEARELLNSGQGERAHIGECVHCEVASVEE